jgi:hypothetical protein
LVGVIEVSNVVGVQDRALWNDTPPAKLIDAEQRRFVRPSTLPRIVPEKMHEKRMRGFKTMGYGEL